MFEFAHSEYIWLMWLIPVMLVIFLFARHKRKSAIRKFGEPDLLESLMPLYSSRRPVLKFVLLLFTIVFVVLALAGPRFGSRLEEVRREGVEIIIALDVSNSMLAEDIRPNRLDRSKMAISGLTRNMRNDRIGLIVFAGDAYVQVPITSDYSAVRMMLNNVTPGFVPVQGTAIGYAIELATRSFSPESAAGKVLIIISDGEDHEDDPIGAAATAQEMGITIHTIGMGRPEGAPIPTEEGNTGFLTGPDGTTVITRLDEAMLKGIASAGNGLFIRAAASSAGLDIIMDEIDKMEKEEFEKMEYTEFEERFQYMAAIALFLLLADFFILDRKNRWLNRINIFRENN